MPRFLASFYHNRFVSFSWLRWQVACSKKTGQSMPLDSETCNWSICLNTNLCNCRRHNISTITILLEPNLCMRFCRSGGRPWIARLSFSAETWPALQPNLGTQRSWSKRQVRDFRLWDLYCKLSEMQRVLVSSSPSRVRVRMSRVRVQMWRTRVRVWV